jgi:hypothetical protein
MGNNSQICDKIVKSPIAKLVFFLEINFLFQKLAMFSHLKKMYFICPLDAKTI